MKHITHTGIHAGQTFCGAVRNPEEAYLHLPILSASEMILFNAITTKLLEGML